MKFRAYQQQFRQALNDEIKTLRKAGGRTATILDGHQVEQSKAGYLYSFTSDTEIRLPDDTPIDLIHQNQKYRGQLVSVTGFDLLISLQADLGEEIKIAKISTEPWFLHQELLKRLDTATAKTTSNRTLAESMLSNYPQSAPHTDSKFEDFIDRIVTQIGTAITHNTSQVEAITHVLRHPVSYIWGPPGTGKTSTLGLTVASLVHSGESVLILAHSNAAVDTAMNSAVRYLAYSSYYREGLMLRYGIPSPTLNKKYENINVRGIAKKQNPVLIQRIQELESQIKTFNQQARLRQTGQPTRTPVKSSIAEIKGELQLLRQQLKSKESELVSQAMVVGCTLSKASIAEEIYNRKFDAVIIDEASMAYIPHCAYAATLANKRVALFGDFRQLGPISTAETESAETWLQRDIYAEAGIIQRVKRKEKDERLVLLKTQYRMHPDIAHIPNQLFYDGVLENGENVAQNAEPITAQFPSPDKALVFYDLSQAYAHCFKDQESHSRFNPISALIAVQTALEIRQQSDASIGIIAPYQSQARLINQLIRDIGLKGVVSSTVHRFQGSEQDMIIFDATDSSPQSKVGKLLQGGLEKTVARLTNVAISRAKGKFISLINYSYFRKQQYSDSIFRKFCDRLRHHSEVIPFQWHPHHSENAIQQPLPNVLSFDSPSAAQTQIHADLRAVKERIAIDWPKQLSATRHFSIESIKSKKLSWIIRGPHAQNIVKDLKNTRIWKKDSFSAMGAIAIDDILWLYTSPDRDAPVFRITLPKTNKLLIRFMELVPTELEQTAKKRIQTPQSLFGLCDICANPLMPKMGRNRAYRLSCTKKPDAHHGRQMKAQDATFWADMMQYNCPQCGSAMKGALNKTYGSLFLVCSSSRCKGTRRLDI